MNAVPIYFDIFLSWQTLLDIILIAAGLFFLYRTLLRLGTWKILAGMLAAFALFVVASLLNLEGIEWIYKNVSHVALLALIIVFQPEIRKIFEKVVSFAVAKNTKHDVETLTVIAESLWRLASQNCGAIVVFPGREQIQDKISGGYPLNAQPSIPLIMSIFDPNSPGHDGALICVDDMFTKFGVRLPMSSSSRLPEDFGTRHHAAQGMAEQTDSLVLLVSEERGQVASFADSKMKKMHSQTEIVDEIEHHFAKYSLRRMTQRIPMSKRTSLQIGASLMLAVVFWSTLILGEKQVVERTLNVPVEYTSPKEGLIFLGGRMTEVAVHAAGPKSAMDDFALSGPSVKVDLGKMASGQQTVLIAADNVKHPKGVKLLDINPSSLELTLAEIVQKKIKVTPQLIGKLPRGLQLKNITVIPQEVEVFAPPTGRENTPLNIFTTPIYLTSIESSSRIVCKIIAPPSYQPVDKRWPDVEVVITVQ